MNANEFATCQKNGVKDVVEVKVGYDGIVLAQSKAGATLKLTRKDVYLALAKNVPDPANPTNLIPNPYTTWKDVNKSLPAMKIEVLGPPPTSGTRDSFVELYMEAGCRTFAWLNALRSPGRTALQARLRHGARRRRLRRSRRERQPHRAEARGQQGCRRHLRLQLPRGEPRQAQGRRGRRRLADVTKPSPRASIPPRVRSSST